MTQVNRGVLTLTHQMWRGGPRNQLNRQRVRLTREARLPLDSVHTNSSTQLAVDSRLLSSRDTIVGNIQGTKPNISYFEQETPVEASHAHNTTHT